jgi:hypothetical protein
MSNLNTILNKLGKIEEIHETNLNKHEVELASATDLPKLYGKAVSMANDLLGDAYRRVEEVKSILRQKEDLGLKMISDLDGAMIDFAKKAKELGIDPMTAPLYKDSKKELDDLYKGVKYVTDVYKKLK